jgi:hypothetical protein
LAAAPPIVRDELHHESTPRITVMIHPRTAPLPSRRLRRTRRLARLGVESLETRALLSSIDTFETILPAVASVVADRGWQSSGGQTSSVLTNPTPDATATTPSQIRSAYGFSTSPSAGAGTTIAIVDAYNDPNIQADLATFSAYYGLAAPSLTVVNQYGQTTNLPATSADWSLEISLDVEWAHAVAPAAKLVLVEASSTSVTDLMTAVQTAARMSNVVSMSWGGSEWSGQKAYDSAAYFANPNVTFVAASGDDGGAYGAEWPASSPYVLGVGGTTLSLTSSGTYGGESAWSASGSWWTGYSGSTGGVSSVESLPSYQASALGSYYAYGRVVPDVSMDANPSTGVSVFDSVQGIGQTGWFKVGGTSAGAPIWAGLVATADQARAASGRGALSSTQTLSLLYSLYGTSGANAATYASAFHDVTSGVNFAGYATTGYDKVTGLGTPVASTIVSAAASYSGVTTSTAPTPARPVLRFWFRAQRHTATDTTTESTTVSATVVVTATTNASEIAALSTPTVPAAASASALAVAPVVPIASGRAEPNQSRTDTLVVVAAASSSEPTAPAVYHGTDVGPGATTNPATVPYRGDFPTPPVLDPTTPIELWDEALASVGSKAEVEVEANLSEPKPFVPWTALEEADEDLSEAAPSLFGAAGLVTLFWLSWNRRQSEGEDDERRSRPFVIPTPSDN